MSRTGTIETSIVLDGCEGDMTVNYEAFAINRDELVTGITAFVRFEKWDKVYIEGTLGADELLALFMALMED